MINYQDIYHNGLLVPDMEAAMQQFGDALNLTWAPLHRFENMPFWTPDRGVHKLDLAVTYSCEGPQHIELLCGSAGTFYDPALSSGAHSGVWVDDVAASAHAMQAQGWVLAGGGAPEAEGFGGFVYLTPPTGGPMIELVSPAIKPAFEKWWSGMALTEAFAELMG